MADIKVIGYDVTEGYYDNGVYCSKLDIYGRSVKQMIWVDYAEEGEGEWYGWYNDDWETSYNDEALQPGEGLWMTFPSANFKVQSAGQVIKGSLATNLVKGNQMCANPMPTTIAMGDSWISGYSAEEGYYDNGVYCSKLDIYGRSVTQMIWVDYSEEGEGEWYGWYNDDVPSCDRLTLDKFEEGLWRGSGSGIRWL